LNQKGIDKNCIISTATSLIEENGYNSFSLHRLAAKLGIKTASLYNHIESLADVNMGIARDAVSKLRKALNDSVGDIQNPGEALMNLAVAYRNYAHQNPELYKVIINLPMMDGTQMKAIGFEIILPMLQVLSICSKDNIQQIHYARAFRSMLHGYVALEATGYFEKTEADANESFLLMIESFIKCLPLTGKQEVASTRVLVQRIDFVHTIDRK
jgi:AcrR family transcriptional regulator